MPACCWFAKDTCCGIRDEIYDLEVRLTDDIKINSSNRFL